VEFPLLLHQVGYRLNNFSSFSPKGCLRDSPQKL
jgi:hypothetical protein